MIIQITAKETRVGDDVYVRGTRELPDYVAEQLVAAGVAYELKPKRSAANSVVNAQSENKKPAEDKKSENKGSKSENKNQPKSQAKKNAEKPSDAKSKGNAAPEGAEASPAESAESKTDESAPADPSQTPEGDFKAA